MTFLENLRQKGLLLKDQEKLEIIFFRLIDLKFIEA